MISFLIAPSVYEAMLEHVRALPDEETCGLLGGKEGKARLMLPVENELHQRRAYQMAPQSLVDALYQLESQHCELLAIYHSHPDGPAMPSQRDIQAFSYPGVVNLIWSPTAESWQLKAFVIEGNRCEEIGWQMG